MSSFEIRPHTRDDDPAIVDFLNRSFPEFPDEDVEDLRAHMEHGPPELYVERWTALQDGEIVGMGHFGDMGTIPSGAFWIDITVDPERQGQGIGGRLFEHLL